MKNKTSLHPDLKFLLFVTPIIIAITPYVAKWLLGDPLEWLQ